MIHGIADEGIPPGVALHQALGEVLQGLASPEVV